MKYAWIQVNRHRYPVRVMCRVLGVSRHGFYHYCSHKGRREDPRLIAQVRLVFLSSNRRYGTRRIQEALRRMYEVSVSRRRIARIMKVHGLVAKRKGGKRIRTTDSRHNLPISPNLLEQSFTSPAPNQVYVGDITYLKTKEGWLYLAVVIDLYARRVLGYAVASHMRSSLVIQALEQAHTKRGGFHSKTIFHSDRGSQYASHAFRELLQRYTMRQSMSGKGNCYDNAACESFFASLKTELPDISNLSKKETIEALNHYIIFYNTKRLHSANDYRPPLETELLWWHNQHEGAA